MIQFLISLIPSSILENIKAIGLWWVLFGFLAQFFFFLRFVVQWIVSERAKKVVMPRAFWYLGITGGIMLFIYVIHRRDPVLIPAQFLMLLIYTRNLILDRREKNKNKCQRNKKFY